MRAKLPPLAAEDHLRIFQVDAFTRTRFTGNPAAVVLDADGQTEATMLSIAREFSHAEVAFVSAATGSSMPARRRPSSDTQRWPLMRSYWRSDGGARG